MDNNKEVSATLYDVYRIACMIKCPEPTPFAKKPDLELYPGFRNEDCWKQLPTKVMIGDGVTFVLIISLELQRNKAGEYLIERMHVQEEVLDFLKQIPVCVGLGVASDITDVQ